MDKKPIVVYYYAGAEKDLFPWKESEIIDYSLRFAVIQKVIDNGHNLSMITSGDFITLNIYKR
jgi:hypothetical protein